MQFGIGAGGTIFGVGGSIPGPRVMLPTWEEATQVAGGGFGMKLDNKPPIMHGNFYFYAVELENYYDALMCGM